MAGEISKFFVTIGSKFDDKGFKSLSAGIKRAGIAIAAFAAAFGFAIFKAVQKASELEEATNKFNVVFSEVKDSADAFAENLVANFGVSTLEARRFLSAIQDFLIPMGLSQKEAALLSNEIVKLASDIGSFNDQPTEQIMRDIQSALTGMALPMRKYGVDVTQTRIEQNILNKGLVTSKKEITKLMKIQETFNIIQADSSNAVGDFARSEDSLANQTKIMKARIEDVTAAIGTAFVPAFKDIIKFVNKALKPIKDYTKDTEKMDEATKKVKDTLILAIQSVKTIGFAFQFAGQRIAIAMAFATLNLDAARIGTEELEQQVIAFGKSIVETDLIIVESDAEKKAALAEAAIAEAELKEQIAVEAAENETEREDTLAANAKTRQNLLDEVAEKSQQAAIDRKKERLEAFEDFAKREARVIIRGLEMVANVEVLTLRSGVKAFSESLKERARQFVRAQVQEVMIAQATGLAKAIINATVTFGSAAAQIGIVLGAAAAGIGSLRALQSFDEAGVVQGPPGKPVLVQALGGEKFLGRQSIGKPAGGVTVVLRNPFFLGSRQDANRLVEIVSDGIFRKVNTQRRT